MEPSIKAAAGGKAADMERLLPPLFVTHRVPWPPAAPVGLL